MSLGGEQGDVGTGELEGSLPQFFYTHTTHNVLIQIWVKYTSKYEYLILVLLDSTLGCSESKPI